MIRVNNRDEVAWEEGLTVSGLLERLNYTYPLLVVKVNGEVIPNESFRTRVVPDGAHVLVVHLAAGG
jgi:thiamine biosynthesis protein ThiS